MPPDDRSAILLISASAGTALAMIYIVKILSLFIYAACYGVPD